nr:hypothetical protein [Candidatus Freyarchaeota archaeon]
MRKKKLIGVLLTVMIAATFSAFALAASGNQVTYSAMNLWTSNLYAYQVNNLYASQVNANDIEGKQGPFSLVTNLDAYYVQESGDIMMFVVVAATPYGIVPGISIGNGTTGWHSAWTDWYTPFVPMNNLNGNVTLFVYGALMKNVWPSGWRTVDECFGFVGLLTPLNNNTGSLPFRVTANGNLHMILILSATVYPV